MVNVIIPANSTNASTPARVSVPVPGETWNGICIYCGRTIQMVRQPDLKCRAFNLDASRHKCKEYIEKRRVK